MEVFGQRKPEAILIKHTIYVWFIIVVFQILDLTLDYPDRPLKKWAQETCLNLWQLFLSLEGDP